MDMELSMGSRSPSPSGDLVRLRLILGPEQCAHLPISSSSCVTLGCDHPGWGNGPVCLSSGFTHSMWE